MKFLKRLWQIKMRFLKRLGERIRTLFRKVHRPKVNLKSLWQNKKVRIGTWVLAALIVFVLATALLSASIVNGIPVSRLAVIRELERQGGQQVLDTLIERELIFQQARKQGIKVTTEVVDAQIKTIEDNLQSQGQTLDEVMSAQGVTRADLVAQIRIQKIVESILGPQISVSDEEISSYFSENQSLYEGKSLADVTDEIQTQLFQQKLSSEYSQWIADLKAKAKIYSLVNYQ